MSDLVIFDKIGFNQAYKTLSDKDPNIGLAALHSLPTILAGIVSITHPCDVEKVLEKPVELLVIFELYIKVPGFAKNILEKTIQSLEGTIPANVDVMTGGVNDELALRNPNDQIAFPNVNNQVGPAAPAAPAAPVDPELADLDKQIALEEKRLILDNLKSRRTAIQAQTTLLQRHINKWEAKTIQELQSAGLSVIFSGACLCILYSTGVIGGRVAANTGSLALNVPGAIAEVGSNIAKDKITSTANVIFSGANAVTTSLSNSAGSFVNSIVNTITFRGSTIQDQQPTPTPIPSAIPTPTVGERISEAIPQLMDIKENSDRIINGIGVFFQGVEEKYVYMIVGGIYVVLWVIFFIIFRYFIVDSKSPGQLIEAIKMLRNEPVAPVQNLIQGQPVIQNVVPRQPLGNAAVENNAIVPPQPQQNPNLRLGDQPQALPVAAQNQPPDNIGIRPDPRAFQEELDGGFIRDRRLPSLPTLRARHSSSSKKKRYTHRRLALRTGKGGYQPTKTGRKV
jgi:hypothetical protein